ncbi:replication factor C subunit, putative [Entamoeba invadens IP1]|uniref:replication factor C subunit, putative n=1 Tax=Entamoeba invadens IP1 TaxID=370355 RepID=UPI0002C3E97D|nr:replication factor C subunit, putative [Entamoeba invadens IP1]ELP94258.1 replication factor C subunit, putative [Entamoeba invadens IP1]|eukprot:XP_004261029.1 replication factor C subunit, putative [Entamoeba invadens IP1]
MILKTTKSKEYMSETNAWSEKYRPKKLDEVKGQEEVIKLLKSSLTSGLPNLLFFGPPGSGKTTSILALSRELFGNCFKDRVLELNASNERGIDMIRTTLKNYAMQDVSHQDGIPDYKLIILDESDALTPDAQTALRRMMEDFTRNTRFCLICNYISRILPPISSRCIKFRFNALPQETVFEHLTSICEKEKFDVTPEAIKAVGKLSEGDMRYAIGLLQKLSQGVRHSVTPQDISNVAGVVPNLEISQIILICKEKTVFDIYLKVLHLVVEENYAADSILSQIRDIFTQDTNGLTETQRCNFLLEIADTDAALIDRADPLFAISSLLGTLFKYYHKLA